MLYRTILCASDGQPHSERALLRAAELADECRAELHVVHVPEPEPDMALVGRGDYVETMRGEREREVRARIGEIGCIHPELLVVPHLLRGGDGPVARRIAAIAERIDADLIVAGSRRRSALGSAIAGSVSRRLMRETRRPVLILAGETPSPRRLRAARRALHV